MKKLLALVLALVMTLGLATVGTNAAKVEYKDAKDIKYKEAVDVMSAIGVLGGDENGFRPTDELKRSEGAKIIAYLMLGNATAEQMTGGNKFTDVPASHWAAGYIEYLAVEGIVGGIGDNKFDPDGTLTTAAFTKMLLGALGYDAVIEGLGGDDWMINVQRLAKQIKLFDGNSGAVASANIKREEAALYAFNMICSPLVEYENKGSSMTVNGATISFGAGKAQYKVNTGKDLRRYAQIDAIQTNDTGNQKSQIIEFAEEYYDKLIRNDGAGKDNHTDGFGRPNNKWVYDGKEIGSYTVAEDLLYTSTVTLGQIYKDLALTDDVYITNNKLATGASLYFIDGQNANGGQVKIKKESADKIGGNGCETYVYYNEGTVRVCEVNWYVGDVAGVYAATASKEAYIDIAGRGVDIERGKQTSGTKKTTDYKVDDVVLYTLTFDNLGNPSVEDVMKAEVLEGELNSFVKVGVEGIYDQSSTGSVTLGGKQYTYSAKVADTPDGTFLRSGVNLKVVLDKYGYAIDVGDYGVQNYAVVTNVSGRAGNWNDSKMVELLFTDGSQTGAISLSNSHAKDVVKVDNAGNALAAADYEKNQVFYPNTTVADGKKVDTVQKYDIVTYTIGSNGNYTLTLKSHATTWKSNQDAGKPVTNGDYALGAKFDDLIQANANGRTSAANRANGKTVFLIHDPSDNYKVYDGIKDVPTVLPKSGTFYINSYAAVVGLHGDRDNDAAAAIVFIDISDGQATLSSHDIVFVHMDKRDGQHVNGSGETYYEVLAFVNGERRENLKVSEESIRDLYNYGVSDGDGGYYGIFYSMSENSKGIYKLDEIQKNMPLNGTYAEKNGTIGLGNTWYSYAKDVKVYYINENLEISNSSIKGIPENTNTKVWYGTDNNDVTAIFWTKNAIGRNNVISSDGWAIPTGGLDVYYTAAEANQVNRLGNTQIGDDLDSGSYDVIYVNNVPNAGFRLNDGIPAGQTVVIEGNVTVNAPVEGTLYATGKVTLTRNVVKGAYVRATDIVVTDNVVAINGTLVASDSLTINNEDTVTIGQDAKVTAGEAVINGGATIDGKIVSANKLTIQENSEKNMLPVTISNTGDVKAQDIELKEATDLYGKMTALSTLKTSDSFVVEIDAAVSAEDISFKGLTYIYGQVVATGTVLVDTGSSKDKLTVDAYDGADNGLLKAATLTINTGCDIFGRVEASEELTVNAPKATPVSVTVKGYVFAKAAKVTDRGHITFDGKEVKFEVGEDGLSVGGNSIEILGATFTTKGGTVITGSFVVDKGTDGSKPTVTFEGLVVVAKGADVELKDGTTKFKENVDAQDDGLTISAVVNFLKALNIGDGVEVKLESGANVTIEKLNFEDEDSNLVVEALAKLVVELTNDEDCIDDKPGADVEVKEEVKTNAGIKVRIAGYTAPTVTPITYVTEHLTALNKKNASVTGVSNGAANLWSVEADAKDEVAGFQRDASHDNEAYFTAGDTVTVTLRITSDETLSLNTHDYDVDQFRVDDVYSYEDDEGNRYYYQESREAFVEATYTVK